MDLDRVLEEVAFSGSTGLNQIELVDRLQRVYPQCQFDAVTCGLIWKRVSVQPEVECLVSIL